MGHSALFPTAVPEGKAADIVFEQYKLAVEMWDRVRARRQTVNAFYATISAAIVGLDMKGETVFLSETYAAVGGV
jgi:hypothetical protein